MKVSFGIINYNRLFYLKSCAESLMESVKNYPDVEFICIDDNSVEPGTKEYLETLKKRGWIIINQQENRNYKKQIKTSYDNITHLGPFAEALNIFNNTATGDLIAPLQGDMQFIRKNWLQSYVDLFNQRDDVFSIIFDAQRKVRLENRHYEKFIINDSIFAIENGRKIGGAGDVLIKKEWIDMIGGWQSEDGQNEEDQFTAMATKAFHGKKNVFVPWVPPAIVIATDKRGTNARVRGNKRYGDYWEAQNDLYYKWIDIANLKKNKIHPYSIEELAVANGNWELPIDKEGNWKKLGSSIDLDSYEIIE